MAEARTSVTYIKSFMYKTKDKKLKYNGGEMHFGMEVLLFVLVIFIIWVFTGGPTHESAKKPFVKPKIDTTTSIDVYGQNEK